MLHRALRQVLPFGNALRLEAAFHDNARNAAQPKLDRKSNADGATADNDDLMPLDHFMLRHCEEQSDEAIQTRAWIASLCSQ
jgi:hypothetical protein